jgi:uncharacterized surface protein with fasciclin (FAS1) repeats
MKLNCIITSVAFTVAITLAPNVIAGDCAAGKNASVNTSAAEKDIVAVASGAENFKTLVAAVKAAGLVETLQSKGPFTVFAPTDEAFAKLPPGTLEDLLKPENKEKLVAILKYHVLPGKVLAADVKTMEVKTVQGQSVKIKVSDAGAVTVDNAKVMKTDLLAENGVIHVIDSVILPKTSGGPAGTGGSTDRADYETAPYKVVRSNGNFELRDYPALTVVETPMAAGSRDGGFMRLFRFISGGNEAQQKIAMTTPVFMSSNESKTTMAFVMPADMKTSEVPAPSDSAVTVREMAAGRFAVLRYSGWNNAQNAAESLAQLKKWMAEEGLKASSQPVFASFDGPGTPSSLRRNEVMIRTENGN